MSGAGPALAPGCALGIDVGAARLGVAASDPLRTVATPLRTLDLTRGSRRSWADLAREIEERAAAVVVVGLPRQLDGSEGDAAAAARGFAAELRRRTGARVELWDERFTTAMAERSLVAAGVRRSQRRARVDAVAATLILQSWLDSRRR